MRARYGVLLVAGWLVGIMMPDWSMSQMASSAAVQRASMQGRVSASAAVKRRVPPRVEQAQRFLAARGWSVGNKSFAATRARALENAAAGVKRARALGLAAQKGAYAQGSTVQRASVHSLATITAQAWTAAGPVQVVAPGYGLVTGRISSIAVDPNDATGNHLYVGTTGGGVWEAQNGAAAQSSVSFVPLTDSLSTMVGAVDASISVGAVSVQPGGTGVVLAGLGDPNDSLDSYYGAGILRSADGGATWSLITQTTDKEDLLAPQNYSFLGEGFAGFAWSTVQTGLVVGAVSQAYEGVLTNAVTDGASEEGLYYSTDAGATWHMATITDKSGSVVQSPQGIFTSLDEDGVAATSVVWNPVRKIFMAAVRYHGYYQSSEGVTWTRMLNQPGSAMTAASCPTVGLAGCPVFRGALAVNPNTGDTFAWTVDANNQDQGLWQDVCGLANGVCTSSVVAFGRQWPTATLDTSTESGATTVLNGDYTLALTAVPSQQDTLLFAGDDDLWQCSLANSCSWRNTTHAATCMSAGVGEYQHAVAWSAGNPLVMYVGNDSGLWRSTDDVAETGSECATTDASHFTNLNGAIGSLAEVESVSVSNQTPYTMLAGLGANGFTGVNGTAAPSAEWQQVLGGEGATAVIHPQNGNWYASNGAGVSIHVCTSSTLCAPNDFGAAPVIGESDVSEDGEGMGVPAAFMADVADSSQLLVATCRMWRGSAGGSWSTANAISPMLDGSANQSCAGDAVVRSVGAAVEGTANEAIYAGMYGVLDGGQTVAGHVFGAVLVPGSGSVPAWTDLTLSPVTNTTETMNSGGFDVSSIYVDPHDSTGNTVYVTAEGMSGSGVLTATSSGAASSGNVYRSADGGASWEDITANLPNTPVNAVVVDPADANAVYLATDVGVYATENITDCAGTSGCWTELGTGLPNAPVTSLAVSGQGADAQLLTVGTYGRGIWQTPLLTAGETLTTATVSPASLSFASQVVGVTGTAQTVSMKVTGTASLSASSIAMSGDFSETDSCVGAALADGKSCTIKVSFLPTVAGTRTGSLILYANVSGGQISVPLSGTATDPGDITLTPGSLDFGDVQVSTASTAQNVVVANLGGTAVTLTKEAVTPSSYTIQSNTCGSSLAAASSCTLAIVFKPASAASIGGTLTVSDGLGKQTLAMSGTGLSAPTDTLSPGNGTTLSFPDTGVGQTSAALTVTMTNKGQVSLTNIGTSVSGSAYAATSNCGGVLAAGSSCTIAVTFTPTAAATQTGTLTISDALKQQTLSLTGKGTTPPVLALTPASRVFSGTEINTNSSATTFTVKNSGGTTATNISVVASEQFSVTSTTCGATLARGGGTCTAQVVFAPTTVGGQVGTLTASTATLGVDAAISTLSGTGLAPPKIVVTPTSESFGEITVGAKSSVLAVQVANQGGVALTDLQLSVSSGDYSMQSTTCTATLAVGASCQVQLVFAPTELGSRTGTLTASSVSGSSLPATVSLQGEGLPAASIGISLASGQISFGSVPLGTTSAAIPMSVYDLGTMGLGGLTMTVTGPFALTENKCGSTLGQGLGCTLGVAYTPTAVGSQSGLLTISATSPDGVVPVQISLTGTGAVIGMLNANVSSLDLGTVDVGSTSEGQVVVSNAGNAVLEGFTASANGDFSVTSNPCGSELVVGASCTLGLTFKPTASGGRTGVLSLFSSSDGVDPLTVNLMGTGEAPGSLQVAPTAIYLGTQTIGVSPTLQAVTLTNTGGTEIDGIAISASTGFVDSIPSVGGCGSSLAGNASCQVQVGFSPTVTGQITGSLTVTAPEAVTATVALSGTAVAAAVLADSSTQLSFGAVGVGQSSNTLAETISVASGTYVTGLGVALGGTNPRDYSIANSCGSTLSPTGVQGPTSCQITVRFIPLESGERDATLTVTSSSPGVASLQISLTGTGQSPASITASPMTVSFSPTGIGQSSATQDVTVSNAGNVSLTGLSAVVSGGDFGIAAETCGGSLTSGATCTVSLYFAPTAAGARLGTLVFSGSGVQPVTVQLSGTGQQPAALSVVPDSISFGQVTTLQAAASQAVVVSNTGGLAVTGLTIGISSGFSIPSNGCGTTLAAGSSCTVAVSTTPTGTGSYTGALTVFGSNVAAPATVALSAVGEVQSLGASVASLDFSSVEAGMVSAVENVTISNNSQGGATLDDIAVTVTGSGFQVATNGCAASLAPGESCTVGLSFSPVELGQASGTLTVASSGSVPLTVPLTGIGMQFTLPAPTPQSVTVVSGESAYYLLNMAVSGGGPITISGLTCVSPPTNVVCSFNPGSESVGANTAPGQIVVTVATGVGTVSSAVPVKRIPGVGSAMPVAMRLLVGGLLVVPGILPVMLLRRRAAGRGWKGAWMVLVAGCLLVGLSSCVKATVDSGTVSGGGGSGGGDSGESTPAGSYTIPVQVTATGVTADGVTPSTYTTTVNLTLVVD